MVSRRTIFIGLIALGFVMVAVRPAESGQKKSIHLARAVMCENLESYVPSQIAVVFSIDAGRIFCYTEFDNVPAKTFVFHKWYRRDVLVTTKRLILKPPRWSSYSSIQLREADKGPWRVVITDQNGAVLRVLRFSVTD